MNKISANGKSRRAKVNLNDSFNASFTSPCDKLLNYSIIENEVLDDTIKLKLRISKSQPKVVLEPLNQNIMNALNSDEKDQSKSDSDIELIEVDDAEKMFTTNRRRSSRVPKPRIPPRKEYIRRTSRAISRVSYNEYVSPKKSHLRDNDQDDLTNTTPRKKLNNGSLYHNHNAVTTTDLDSPSKLGFENVSISTPAKRTSKRQLSMAENQNEATPKKYNFGEMNVKTRMSSRASKLGNTNKVYVELEQLLAPMINIKFSDKADDQISTPKKTRTKPAVIQAKTPANHMKLLRNGDITPTMHNRQNKVAKAGTPLNIVKEKLHVSYVPKALPCREREYADIYSFVEGKLLDGCGGCMYISGVPGTGKTATVSEVIRQLQTRMKSKKIPDFIYVSINGMRLTEPRQSYVEILKQLTGKTHGWEQAQSTLEARFTKAKQKKEAPIVLLVDELDILCTKRQDVVYNLLDWPTKAKSQLIVITIANTMDLPERLLMGRVTSRLGLTRLTFQAYTHKQLQEIVMKRLLGTNAFNPDAVQLVARKVASVSGDARRALDICRRAAEVAELEGDDVLVSMQHVDEALNSMITQPKVRAIRRCSRLEQLILQAIAAEVERTGVDETTFSDVYTMLTSVAGIDGFRMVSITVALTAVKYLAACRLLLSDAKTCDLNQKLILNVSADDIYYALRKS